MIVLRRNRLKVEPRREQMGKSKSHKHSQIEVVTNWQHIEEVSPAFKKLMSLLLKPRSETNNRKEESDEAS